MSELGPEARSSLLLLARASVHDVVHGGSSAGRLVEQTPIPPELERRTGAFVSLKLPAGKQGERETLRGCIGSMAAVEPLYRNVIHVAARAACADPRFPPLTAEELGDLRIEISVLTPLSRVSGLDEIEVGRDGVQLVKGSACAVFLPQVAAERSWSVKQLLGQLSLKAGLAEDGWVGGELSVFQAEVFRDD